MVQCRRRARDMLIPCRVSGSRADKAPGPSARCFQEIPREPHPSVQRDAPCRGPPGSPGPSEGHPLFCAGQDPPPRRASRRLWGRYAGAGSRQAEDGDRATCTTGRSRPPTLAPLAAPCPPESLLHPGQRQEGLPELQAWRTPALRVRRAVGFAVASLQPSPAAPSLPGSAEPGHPG